MFGNHRSCNHFRKLSMSLRLPDNLKEAHETHDNAVKLNMFCIIILWVCVRHIASVRPLCQMSNALKMLRFTCSTKDACELGLGTDLAAFVTCTYNIACLNTCAHTSSKASALYSIEC